MGKIGKNAGTLTSRSSETVCRTKKLTDLGNSLALGLKCAVNIIFAQCIIWAAGWSG